MRREDLYLSDIVEATDAIARFISGITWDRFRNDELVQSAALAMHYVALITERFFVLLVPVFRCRLGALRRGKIVLVLLLSIAVSGTTVTRSDRG